MARKRLFVGFTLVELMVGMTIGLLVVLAVSFVFLSVVRSSAETLASARLNHDLRAAMTLITSDLRRAGYLNTLEVVDLEDDPEDFRTAYLQGEGPYLPPRFLNISPDGDCVGYAYDRDGGGELEANEHFGIRRHDAALQIWAGAGPADCDTDPGWEDLVGDSTVVVTHFLVTTQDAADPPSPLAPNRVRLELAAELSDTRAGRVELRLSELVYLRNAQQNEPVLQENGEAEENGEE